MRNSRAAALGGIATGIITGVERDECWTQDRNEIEDLADMTILEQVVTPLEAHRAMGLNMRERLRRKAISLGENY